MVRNLFIGMAGIAVLAAFGMSTARADDREQEIIQQANEAADEAVKHGLPASERDNFVKQYEAQVGASLAPIVTPEDPDDTNLEAQSLAENAEEDAQMRGEQAVDAAETDAFLGMLFGE